MDLIIWISLNILHPLQRQCCCNP